MEPYYAFVNLLGRGALAALGVDVRGHGVENIPTSGPVLLAATHVSYPDFVMIEKIAVSRGRYVRFMTRYDAWVPVRLAPAGPDAPRAGRPRRPGRGVPRGARAAARGGGRLLLP